MKFWMRWEVNEGVKSEWRIREGSPLACPSFNVVNELHLHQSYHYLPDWLSTRVKQITTQSKVGQNLYPHFPYSSFQLFIYVFSLIKKMKSNHCIWMFGIGTDVGVRLYGSLRLLHVGYNQMKLKFEAKSARVKGVAFHPSKPWVITSLHSGVIQIWDYNMKLCVAKFEGHDGPARGVDFHPQLPLFVSGGDDGVVKVWDLKQKRCQFSLKGHIDYIRSTFFHHELPWILSACDDQTMRIWNYQSRACVNIITGHAHYVMCAQFHPEKNLIVSASLDNTVRLWDFSVLRKKLTESRNIGAFIGVEIECIKVLDGHERGCNWVCFHPTQNIIASCSDDRKIKLWKYTNEVAWEHSTIPAHKNNVSCVLFDEKSNALISNSEDKTLKLWNYETKTATHTEKRQADRYWILRATKNGNLLAAGHDSGLQVWELNKEVVPHGLVGAGLLVFAQGMKTLLYDVEKNVQKQELYQYNPKDKNALTFISRLIVNHFDPSVFMVQVNQNSSKTFMVKKKESYLNFPNIHRQYEALDSCFLSQTHLAILASPTEIHIQRIQGEDKKQILRLSDKMTLLRLFSSAQQNELILTTKDSVLKYDLKAGRVLGQAVLEEGADIRGVVVGKERVALCGRHVLLIASLELEILATIHQKFSIQSAFWERDNLLFYTTKNHWKYALLNGETGVLRTLDQPLHLVRKLADRKFLAFNATRKVFEIECPEYLDIEFKLAVQEKAWSRVQEMVKTRLGKQKKNLVGYLVGKGYAAAAVELADTPEEKFALAVQASDFQLAFEVCSQINTQEYWKLLGEEALKQGIFNAYELASQKQKQYDRLNFLYSLQHNTPKLEKILKLANKTGNTVLAFNAALFLNSPNDQNQLLRDCGLGALAELAQQAQSGQLSERLKSLGSRPLTPIQPVGEDDFSNWPHNEQEKDE